MKLVMLTLVCLLGLAASTKYLNHLAESQDIINYVNNAKTTWKAARNFHPEFTKVQARRLLGFKEDPVHVLPVKESSLQDVPKIPNFFDSRMQWFNCSSMWNIKDQSDCGSCWAVSAASTFSDRLCIVSNGEFKGDLAAAELLSCCWFCGAGCDGGYLGMTWWYLWLHGLVTGGDYGSSEGCQPYPLEPCEHHVNGSRTQCTTFNITTPKCSKTCTNADYSVAFKSDNHKVHKAYKISSTVEEIQQEIMTNGPVQAAFTVYSDFYSYESGVYQHVTGDKEGGHAVKIMGWGDHEGSPYWLVANSWNSDWGELGFFKILRGNNECGIEDNVHAGIPIWSSKKTM